MLKRNLILTRPYAYSIINKFLYECEDLDQLKNPCISKDQLKPLCNRKAIEFFSYKDKDILISAKLDSDAIFHQKLNILTYFDKYDENRIYGDTIAIDIIHLDLQGHIQNDEFLHLFKDEVVDALLNVFKEEPILDVLLRKALSSLANDYLRIYSKINTINELINHEHK
jgi:hypothetical protein